MHKLRVHSAIGKGRPATSFPYVSVSLGAAARHFHSSASQNQEVIQDAPKHGLTKPLLSKSERNEEQKRVIQELYQRSISRDNSRPSNRLEGVPLSKELLEGRKAPRRARSPANAQKTTAQRPTRNKSAENRNPAAVPAIDASSLAASPKPGAPRFTITKTFVDRPVVRERAEPRDNHRPSRSRSQDQENHSQSSGSGGGRQSNNRDPARFQRPPQKSQSRPQMNSSRPKKAGTGSRQQNGPPGKARQRPGGSRDAKDPRATQEVDSKFESMDEHENRYRMQREEMLAPKAVAFEPEHMQRESLQATRPAIVSGQLGMREILGQRLDLARKVIRKDMMQWDSKEEKADVLAIVEQCETLQTNAKGALESAEIGHNRSVIPVEPTDHVEQVMQKLFGGSYHIAKPSGQKDILGHVARLAGRNETYFPDDGKSLLAKVKSLVAASQMGGKDARKAVAR